jgi:hypothetical protein
MKSISAMLLVCSALVAGCGDERDARDHDGNAADVDVDTDIDGDADTDTDADAETDSETGTDTGSDTDLGGGDSVGHAVAVDGAGSVYVTGGFEGAIDLGGGPLIGAGSYDILLAKFDAAGDHLWSQRYGGSGTDFGWSVTVGADGDLLLSGSYEQVLDLGDVTLTTEARGAFLAKLDPGGDVVWVRGCQSVGSTYGGTVSPDSEGGAFWSGGFDGSIDLGAGAHDSAGDEDGFLARIDSGGDAVWSVRIGDTGFDFVTCDTAAGGDEPVLAGDSFATGHFSSTVDFGPGPITSAGGGDVFVARFTASGDPVWSAGFGDEQSDDGLALAVDGQQNVVVAGLFFGTIDFGGGPLISNGEDDSFVAKLDADGGHLWSGHYGGAFGMDRANGVAVDDDDNVLVTGSFTDGTDFGDGPVSTDGVLELFLVKLSPDGDLTWVVTSSL